MLCSDALCELIELAGFATRGTTLFSDFLPERQNAITIAVIEDPSSAWVPFRGTTAAGSTYIDIQVRAEPHEYALGQEAAMNLYLWLTRQNQVEVNVVSGSTTYRVRILGIVPDATPSLVKRDDSDRPIFGMALHVMYSLPDELNPALSS